LLFQAASPSLAQPTIVAVFVAAFVWYIRFAKQRAELSPAASSQTRRSLWTMLIEVAKTLVLVMILEGLVTQIGIANWTGALWLALVLLIGFPEILLPGSVMYENVP
jgi:hypothetical protein